MPFSGGNHSAGGASGIPCILPSSCMIHTPNQYIQKKLLILKERCFSGEMENSVKTHVGKLRVWPNKRAPRITHRTHRLLILTANINTSDGYMNALNRRSLDDNIDSNRSAASMPLPSPFGGPLSGRFSELEYFCDFFIFMIRGTYIFKNSQIQISNFQFFNFLQFVLSFGRRADTRRHNTRHKRRRG